MRLPQFRIRMMMAVTALVAVELSLFIALTDLFPFGARIERYSFAFVAFLVVNATLFGRYYLERVLDRYKRRMRRRPFRDSR